MIETWDDMWSPSVEAGADIEKFQANYVPASQVLDTLAEKSGYWWKITPGGVLQFLPREEQPAPFELERGDIIGDPEVRNGNPLYRNVQFVKNGVGLTDPITETQRGDGDKREFVMGYDLAEKPTIEVDRGDGFVEEDVGQKGVDEDVAWEWEKNHNGITQDRDEEVLTSSDKIKVTYIGTFPAIARATDTDAITEQEQVEQITTGIVEDAINENVEGRDEALELGNDKLAKYAEKSSQLSFHTRREGLEAGQLLPVNLPQLGLDDENLLITSVTTEDEDGIIFYNVEAVRGPKHETWTDFFKELKKRADLVIREGIDADQILVLPFEFEKDWEESEDPNIFRQIYPSNGDTWEEGFDTTQTWGDYESERWSEDRGFEIFADGNNYPSFETEDRIKYITFVRNGNEVFRKRLANVSPRELSPIESEYYIGPQNFTGTINQIEFVGGFRATAAANTGVVIDSIEFNESKTQLEAYQIDRIDRKVGDY